MTSRRHPRLVAYAALAALGMLGGVALGRPDLIALVAPFAVWLALGGALSSRPRLRVDIGLERSRTAEGEVAALILGLEGGPIPWLELEAPAPAGLEAKTGRIRLCLSEGASETRRLELTCKRWGAYRLGPIGARAQDPFGLFQFSGEVGEGVGIRVYPSWARLRQLVPPARTQVFAGNRIARQSGEGIEFAEVREFLPGDRVRHINWRVTARTGVPHVNLLHLERNSDVILFIDSFTEVGQGRDTVLSLAVRAAAALAEGHLRQRDRVGVVGFGGLVRWLHPAMGPRHLYRVVEALLDTDVVTSYAWRDLEVIPPRVLPPAALVVALSPLLDPRSLGAMADLHHRGFDLLVLEIAPERLVGSELQRVDELALRVWRAQRDARRHRLQRSGVGVVEWHPEVPLEVALAAAREYRRSARPALR